VTNATALVAAHRRATVADGFVLVARTSVRLRGPPVFDGSNRSRVVGVVATPGLDRYRVRRRARDVDGCLATDRWSNGSAAAHRRVEASAPDVRASGADGVRTRTGAASDGGVDRRVDYPAPTPAALAPATATLATLVERATRKADYDLVAVREAVGSDRDGAGRRYVLSADDYVPGREQVEADRVGLSSRLVVDGRGRIRALRTTVVRSEHTTWGQSRRVAHWSYRLVAVGIGPASVPRPAWLDAARTADAVAGPDDGGTASPAGREADAGTSPGSGVDGAAGRRDSFVRPTFACGAGR
jgi:hypothetical protein